MRKIELQEYKFRLTMAYSKNPVDETIVAESCDEAWVIIAHRVRGRGPYHITKIQLLTSPADAIIWTDSEGRTGKNLNDETKRR